MLIEKTFPAGTLRIEFTPTRRSRLRVMPVGEILVGERAAKRVRPPYSTEFIDCTCGAVEKDACACIKAWVDARGQSAA